MASVDDIAKLPSSQDEERALSHDETQEQEQEQKQNFKVDYNEIDNYHGIQLQTVMVYFALCLQYFVQLFNVVGSGAFSRNVAADIGGSDKIVWLSQAIVIVTAVLGPPAAQATDYWGRKWFLVAAPIFGVVGSLILARANSMEQAIGGQVVSSVLYIGQPILIAVASEILPRRFRPIAQGGLNASGAAGAIVGLLAGASLTSSSVGGWRNYWYIVTALLGASAITIAFLYNPPLRPLQKSLNLRQKLAHLDWVAYALLAAGLILFTMGLSWGNNPFSWKNAHVLAPLIVGAILFTPLIVHQTLFKKDGLLHHDLFKKDRNLALALGCFFADGMIFFAGNNYFSFEVSVLYESDPLLSGLHFCIAFFAAILASVGVAVITKFTKAVREPIVISFIMFIIFFVLMATAKLSDASAAWGYPVFLGLGMGWSLTYLVAVAQLSAPPHLIAITSGILLAIRSLGGSIGLAIYTAIFNSGLSSHLGHDIAAAVLPLGLPPQSLEPFIGALAAHDDRALGQIPGITPQIISAGVHALQGAYLKSFRGVWIAAAVFSAVTAITSCFFINPYKDLNNHVDAPLDSEEESSMNNIPTEAKPL